MHSKQRIVLGLAPADLGETGARATDHRGFPDIRNRDRVPPDRILVATSRIERLTLVTRDRAILDYAARGHLRALSC